MIVATDWLAKKMYDLGYLQKLDKEALAPALREPKPGLEAAQLRSRAGVLHPVAERDDGVGRERRRGTRHHLDQRSLRPAYKGRVG